MLFHPVLPFLEVPLAVPRARRGLVRAPRALALVLAAEPVLRLLVLCAVVRLAPVAPAERRVALRGVVAPVHGARVPLARLHRGLSVGALAEAEVGFAGIYRLKLASIVTQS